MTKCSEIDWTLRMCVLKCLILLGDNKHSTPFPRRPPMINRASKECATITLNDEVYIASLV